MLCERSQTQKGREWVIPFVYGARAGPAHRTRKQSGGCQGLGQQGWVQSCASPGMHLKDNARLWKPSRHFGRIWSGASGLWPCFSKPSLLGMETEGLCQRRASLGTLNGKSLMPGRGRTGSQAGGPLMLGGAEKALQYSPICFWLLVKTKRLRDIAYQQVTGWNRDVYGTLF